MIRRLRWFSAALAMAGTCGFGIYAGWRGAAGFAIGAAASWWNFQRLKSVAEMAGSPDFTGMPGVIAWMLFRFIVLLVGAFVILKWTTISLAAAGFGLFLSVGAVVLEAIFELVTERNDL